MTFNPYGYSSPYPERSSPEPGGAAAAVRSIAPMPAVGPWTASGTRSPALNAATPQHVVPTGPGGRLPGPVARRHSTAEAMAVGAAAGLPPRWSGSG